jgi:hypothetical protein
MIRDAARSSDERLMNSLKRLSYGQRRHSSVHNETLSVAVRVSNSDRSPLEIQS